MTRSARYWIAWVFFSVLLGAPALHAEASDPSESTPVSTETHDQGKPVVSACDAGIVVVWQDNRPDGKKEGTEFPSSVYGRYIDRNEEFAVFVPSDETADQPAISGPHVVFRHSRGWTNVILAGLPGLKRETIGDVAFAPAIDGNLVVFASSRHRWEGWSGKGAPPTSWISDIAAYEVGGIGVAFDVTNTDFANQTNPDVSGTTVVWQEGTAPRGWNNTAIFKRDIDMDPEPVRICGKPGKSAQNPAICGSIIVWQDNRNGDWDIYGYDLDQRKEIEVCLGPGDQALPAIDGTVIVWQDNRHGDWDIYAHNLATRQTFPVYQGKGNQTEPDIYKGTVIWTDDRNGNADIYMNIRTKE